MKGLLFAMALAAFGLQVNAQYMFSQNDPYQEWFYTGGSVVLWGTGYSIQRMVPAFEPADLYGIKPENVRPFDRVALDYWSPEHRQLSDVLLFSSPLLAGTLMLDEEMRGDSRLIAHMGVQTFFLNLALKDVTKTVFKRTRPFVYNPDVPIGEKLSNDSRLSFYSGHTSTAAAMSFFTASIYSGYHPNGFGKYFVWSGALIYPAVMGYLGVRSGKHFPSDVLVGYLTGAAIGCLVPKLHRKVKRRAGAVSSSKLSLY